MNQIADSSNLSEPRVQSCLSISLWKPCPSNTNSSKKSESRQLRTSARHASRNRRKSFLKQSIKSASAVRRVRLHAARRPSSPVWTSGKHGVPDVDAIASKILRRRRFRARRAPFRSGGPTHRSASIHTFSLRRYLRFPTRLNTRRASSVSSPITFSNMDANHSRLH